MPESIEIDARGLLCPMPVLKLEKQLDKSSAGAEIIVLTDDPVARVDIPVLCEKLGHSYKLDAKTTWLQFTIVKR